LPWVSVRVSVDDARMDLRVLSDHRDNVVVERTQLVTS